MTRKATWCVLSAVALMMTWFVVYKFYTHTVLDGYEATMTKITDLLTNAHIIYIKTKNPPTNISSCIVNDNFNNNINTNKSSFLVPILDYWGQAMEYSLSKKSITILSSGADLKMGTKDDISGVLVLSGNRDIVVNGRYKENIFYQSNYSSHEDMISSEHTGDESGQRDKQDCDDD